MEGQSEIETLRAEIAMLRDIMRSQERENTTLRNILSDQARPGGGSQRATVVQIGSRERMAMLENTVDVLDAFAQDIGHYGCYDACAKDKDDRQPCMPCRAKQAIKATKEWRYGKIDAPSRRFEGSFFSRTLRASWPRETKIHQAWVRFFDADHRCADRTLGMILTEDRNEPIDWPTARDWYVATSVVQWLVTNVGSSILTEAGWQYTRWDEDRKAWEDQITRNNGSEAVS